MGLSEKGHASDHGDVALLEDLVDVLEAAGDVDRMVEPVPGGVNLALLGRQPALVGLELDADSDVMEAEDQKIWNTALHATPLAIGSVARAKLRRVINRGPPGALGVEHELEHARHRDLECMLAHLPPTAIAARRRRRLATSSVTSGWPSSRSSWVRRMLCITLV